MSQAAENVCRAVEATRASSVFQDDMAGHAAELLFDGRHVVVLLICRLFLSSYVRPIVIPFHHIGDKRFHRLSSFVRIGDFRDGVLFTLAELENLANEGHKETDDERTPNGIDPAG